MQFIPPMVELRYITMVNNKAISFLKDEFLREVKVIDAKRGYISASSFNLRMKPAVLRTAAELIVEHFAQEKMTAIYGIPHSGTYLAAAVALQLGTDVRIHASRKDQIVPVSWKEVSRTEVRSFTASLSGVDVFSGINLSFAKKGDRVLLIDDVCGSGNTGSKIIYNLQERGVTVVGFAVLFDKIFQGGLERIEKLGVKTFSCVRVKEIGKNDRVILM